MRAQQALLWVVALSRRAAVATTVHAAAAGVQRFRVLRVIEQAPVLMCEVELLEDEDDTSEEARRPSAADLSLPCAQVLACQLCRCLVQLAMVQVHAAAIPFCSGLHASAQRQGFY